MTTLNLSAKTQTQTRAGYPAVTARFNGIAVLLSLWLVSGLYLDGFVHHNFPQIVESFFSPWHAYLYGGFFALGLFFAANLAQNLRRGYSLARALPKGYGLAALGVPLFFAGGVGDMIWHEVFGFEENIEALLSPTHLLLAGSGFLLVSGAFRAAWLRAEDETQFGWRGLLPPLLSLTFMLSVLTFFSEYAHALTLPDAFVYGPQDGITHYRDVQGLAAVLIPATLTSGIILLALRRWTLPFGALSLILIGNNLLMAWFHARDLQGYAPLFGVMTLAGLAADLLNRALHPGPDRVGAFRLFAFLAPVVAYSLFFGTLIATAGVWWSIHMWAGIIVQAGVIGLLVSWLVLPGRGETAW
ncbi:MAG: hypothetical protein Fur0022_22670 [Anaerolineales bacterium]